MWWIWIIASWLGSPCDTLVPAGEFQLVVEEWHPACFEPHVAERSDPDAFERLAFAWLLAHEDEIAADMAQAHGLRLLIWWHEADYADDSPFGATVVLGLSKSQSPQQKGGSHVAMR